MSKPKKEAKQEVFKHSAAIHIHNNITLLQRRTWNGARSHFSDQAASKARCEVAIRFNMFHRPAL